MNMLPLASACAWIVPPQSIGGLIGGNVKLNTPVIGSMVPGLPRKESMVPVWVMWPNTVLLDPMTTYQSPVRSTAAELVPAVPTVIDSAASTVTVRPHGRRFGDRVGADRSPNPQFAIVPLL